jgi:hypothetical protein
MAWKTLPSGVLMLLASCSDPGSREHGVPGTLVMDRIERQLVALPCVGALDRWERHFYYAYDVGDPRPARLDRNRVAFVFIEAGHHQYGARRVMSPEDLDERTMRTLWGEYHVASDRLFLVTCGDGIGPLSRALMRSFARWQRTP